MVTRIKDQSLILIDMCSVSTKLFGAFFDGLPIMHVLSFNAEDFYVILGCVLVNTSVVTTATQAVSNTRSENKSD